MSVFIRTFVRVLSIAIITTLLSQPVFAAAQMLTLSQKATPHADQSTLIVKLKADANISLSNESFVGPDTAAVTSLNTTLAAYKATHKKSLITTNKAAFQSQRRAVKTSLPASRGDLDNYYTITLAPGQKADDVAKQLKSSAIVASAYAKPLPAPAPVVTPSFVGSQKYLTAAKTGMNVNATIGGTATTLSYPAANGSRVKVADLEYAWNTQHEDISRLRAAGALWANGTPIDPFNDTNHGTAVAGIIAADRNGRGIDGIVPSADFHMVNTYNTEHGWDVANAVYTAANKMTAGDVILLEQQAWAPDNQGYAPIEMYQDVYDAVSFATAKGINVVEPAGNGHQSVWQGYDLSDPIFNGVFTTARANSGAIIVGAGAGGCSTTALHARMAFSNYGSRVNVQGYGECVVTTGYGDLYSGGANAQYAGGFNGTSSASATITGVVAELSSSYVQTNGKAVLPSNLITMLTTGATAQNSKVNPGNIGKLPNMATALPLTDITKPTSPTGLTASVTTSNSITLNWQPASDNLGYVTYVVYRNNSKIASVSSPGYIDTTVGRATSYSYKITAIDASKHASASGLVTIRSL